MNDFFYRTEDISPEEVIRYFVETEADREIISALKGRNPTVIVGSRGVGKSFLLRVAQKELNDSFEEDRVFPVYLSFIKGSLLSSTNEETFHQWMLAKICSSIIRALAKDGLIGSIPAGVNSLAGHRVQNTLQNFQIQKITEQFENSWKPNQPPVPVEEIPTLETVKEALEELSEELEIKRFSLFFDEAAHIFVPEQQRAFFGLFRDLRTHYITCNAAVYPGVTSFGESFQPFHDATMLTLERDVTSSSYIENMREIVVKQADSSTLTNISRNQQNFAILAYAATGNPRVLLKTVADAHAMSSSNVNNTIRDFYRNDIWSEHSSLSDKYEGHKTYIDWGRKYIEGEVLPGIHLKNKLYLERERNTSAYFWVHRDAPEDVREALRVLSYTGVVVENGAGRKATRGEIGSRYMVNLGCLFAMDQAPTAFAFDVAKALTPKRMTEYGSNHPSFNALTASVIDTPRSDSFILEKQLAKPISVLDLTDWQAAKLLELGLHTVGDVLGVKEETLLQAYYVGPVRAKRMRNAATASVLEYLSG